MKHSFWVLFLLLGAVAAGESAEDQYIHRSSAIDANDALRESRNAMEPYDGVAELWWDDEASLTGALSNDEGQAASLALLDDEMIFIDLEKSSLWMNQEDPVID